MIDLRYPISAYAEVGEDLDEVERQLRSVLQSDTPLVTALARHPLDGGGKRLRPALALLGGRFWRAEERERVIGLATAVELIHMATLVHDDIVDRSTQRRGKETVNARWGDRMAVLTGDYLFGCAFTLVARWGTRAVIDSLSRCVMEMAKGEILQFQRTTTGRFVGTEADYLEWIDRKTALFIAESAQMGAMAAGAPEALVVPLWRYGRALGLCFQIIDDLLDLTAPPERTGKPTGSDLRNGVITLPVIHALRESGERGRLLAILRDGRSEESIREAVGILERAGSLEYATSRAASFAAAACRELESLPDIPARRALAEIADHLLHRTH